MAFVINWRWQDGARCYVTHGQPNAKPYTRDPNDPDTQRWASRANAERFLSRKDPSWAAKCVIEEVP